MYYLISRYYDPNVGRFITKDNVQADQINPITQNLYTYTGNNPINFTDPDGHSFLSFLKKKSQQFLGFANKAVRVLEKVVSTPLVSNIVFNVVGSFSPSIVTPLKIAHKTMKLIKYGKNMIKALSRGKKPSFIKKLSNFRKSFNRVKTRAISGLYNHMRKNKVSVKRSAKINKGIISTNGRIDRYACARHYGIIAFTRIPLNNGGWIDVHSPREGPTGQYHGHEYDRNGNDTGRAENADGSIHHKNGKPFSKRTKQELENNKTWKAKQKLNEKHKQTRNKNKIVSGVGLGFAGIVVYEITKWGISIGLAPETFGGSLAGAAALP